MMTLQEIIETRQPGYLRTQVENLLRINETKPLNEHQWKALHYMQFCLLLSEDV